LEAARELDRTLVIVVSKSAEHSFDVKLGDRLRVYAD
jgi:hypothetical protein